MKKRILSVVLAAAMLASMTACGSSSTTQTTAAPAATTAAAETQAAAETEAPAAETEAPAAETEAPAEAPKPAAGPFNVGISFASANAWTAQMYAGVEERVKYWQDQGVIGDYQIVTNTFDPTEQLNQVNALLSSDIDVLFVSPVSSTSMDAVVEEAEELGIKVFFSQLEATCDGTGFVANSDALGALNAYWFKDKMEKAGLENGNIIWISGDDSTFDIQSRMKSATEIFNDQFNVLGRAPGFWNDADASNATSTLLSAYGDQVQGIFAEDAMTVGIYQALKNAGYTDDNLPVMTGDNAVAALKLAKDIDADWIGVTNSPYVFCTGIDMGILCMLGYTFDESLKQAPLTAPEGNKTTFYIDPPVVVTKDGDRDAMPWMENYPNTEVYSIDEALALAEELGLDDSETLALKPTCDFVKSCFVDGDQIPYEW